jgi:hypothetical protein
VPVRSLSLGAPAANGRVAQAGRLRFFVHRPFPERRSKGRGLRTHLEDYWSFIRSRDGFFSPPSERTQFVQPEGERYSSIARRLNQRLSCSTQEVGGFPIPTYAALSQSEPPVNVELWGCWRVDMQSLTQPIRALSAFSLTKRLSGKRTSPTLMRAAD